MRGADVHLSLSVSLLLDTPTQVVRDKYKGKSKGYGFVSFLDPFEGLKGA